MSDATRRIRSELAIRVLVALGLCKNGAPDSLSDDQRVAKAEAALSERMQVMIDKFRKIGISQAKIAREIHVDPSAVNELADGGTSRLGFETIWDAHARLSSFFCHTSELLRATVGSPCSTHAELLGFSGHPDRAKMKGTEGLAIIGHNVSVVAGNVSGTLRTFGPDIEGASSAYINSDGSWTLIAHICSGTDMTRTARDEIWHLEQWLRKQDKESTKPDKPKSAF
jgi:predicted XRE-type DNA-binding protein